MRLAKHRLPLYNEIMEKNNPPLSDQGKQSGQILLISLLVLSVATTIALSLVGRTATDQNISNEIEESSRALSAAEAGVEQALKSGAGSGGAQVLAPSITYTTSLASIGSAAGPFLFPQRTTRNTTETLWLVNHNADGTLNIIPTYVGASIDVCWSTEATTPALVVTVLYKKASDGSFRTAKAAFDPNSARQANNKFTLAGGSGTNCTQAGYKATISFAGLGIAPASDTLIALRLRPLYFDAQLGIDSGVNVLPLQGNRIDSSGSIATGITRRVVVYQQYRAAQSVFDSAIFSQSGFGH